MINLRYFVVISVICSVIASCAESDNIPDSVTAHRSVNAYYDQWFSAMENEDIDSFISLLGDDFYIKSPASPAITDTAALRSGLEQYHQAFKSEVDWEIEDLQVFDNHAVARVSESILLINRQTGDSSRISGVHLAVLEMDSNHNWKLQTDISSLNHPLSSK